MDKSRIKNIVREVLSEIKINKPIINIVKNITPKEWEMLLIRADDHTVEIIMRYGFQRGGRPTNSYYPYGDFVKKLPIDKQIQLYQELYDELKDTTDDLGKNILKGIKND